MSLPGVVFLWSSVIKASVERLNKKNNNIVHSVIRSSFANLERNCGFWGEQMFKYLKPAGCFSGFAAVTINAFFLVEDQCNSFVAVRSEALGKRKLVRAIMASL